MDPVIIVEIMLDGVNWTNVSEHVLQDRGIPFQQGMMDNHPLTRVAEPGYFRFTLKNIDNYYTPGSASCRVGFEVGKKARLRVSYYMITRTIIYGTIPTGGITMKVGLGTSETVVEVGDYMEQLALHEMYLPPFTTLKTSDEIVHLIVANTIAPLSEELHTGETTYETVFDTLRSKTRAIGEVNKVTLTELGHTYVKTSKTSDEVLVSDGKLERSNTVGLAQITNIDTTEVTLLAENGNEILQENGETILLDLLAVEEDAIYDNSMTKIESSSARNYANTVRVIVTPRRVDAAAVVLYSNPRPFFIASGDTKVFSMGFRDPDGKANKVSCDGNVEVFNSGGVTDYKFTQNEDGSGEDRTNHFTAGLTFVQGAEGIEYTVTPTDSGWVFILQARGKGVYTYEPVETIVSTALVTTEGEIMMTFDMKYLDKPLEADDLADVLLDRYSQKDTIVDSVEFIANRNEFLMMTFLTLQVGDKIWIKNTKAEVNAYYFINGKKGVITKGGIIRYQYILSPAAYDSFVFWELEVVGKGELEVNTFLGF